MFIPPATAGSANRKRWSTRPSATKARRGFPGKRGALLAKRLLDVTGSVVGIALSLPVLLIVPLAVKLDSPGPVFFRQKRVGRGGKTFTFLKFRSMRSNNDPAIHREFVTRLINGEDPNAEKGKKGVFKIQDDPRVTRVGKFIRKTSLDELPQFFNVLMGDMSLVGPRPPIPYEVDSYDLWHRRRVTDVKPGITGLWQVEGRSSTTFADMVRLDLKYIREWSLWLDIKILAADPEIGSRRQGGSVVRSGKKRSRPFPGSVPAV